jgi:hypothetical protein
MLKAQNVFVRLVSLIVKQDTNRAGLEGLRSGVHDPSGSARPGAFEQTFSFQLLQRPLHRASMHPQLPGQLVPTRHLARPALTLELPPEI